MINVDELLNGFNLWEDDPDEAPAESVSKVSTDGEIFTEEPVKPISQPSSTEHVGRLEAPDPERAFVDALDDMVIPKTKPQKVASTHPQIVVIDDDFSTLDLMKIYLQRAYDYQAFDNSREAVFYLNKHIPDLIFLDCYVSMVPAKKIVEIIRSYPEFENVPIYLLAEADEKGAIEAKISNHDFEGVAGVLTRPVARGELQEILDAVFNMGETA